MNTKSTLDWVRLRGELGALKVEGYAWKSIMPYAHLEFILPNETMTRKQVLYPYSMKDASQAIDENKGTAYFVPHGFQPILVPLDEEDATIKTLLELSGPVIQVPVPLKQTLLPHYIIRHTKRQKAAKQSSIKKPPRPPNAFILYRKNQQAHILRQNANLCNNDVSRIIGSMWNGESPAVKEQFHLLAQEMKEKHRAMYPMYRYCPRKASRPKRRTVSPVTEAKSPLSDESTGQDMNWSTNQPIGQTIDQNATQSTNQNIGQNTAQNSILTDFWATTQEEPTPIPLQIETLQQAGLMTQPLWI